MKAFFRKKGPWIFATAMILFFGSTALLSVLRYPHSGRSAGDSASQRLTQKFDSGLIVGITIEQERFKNCPENQPCEGDVAVAVDPSIKQIEITTNPLYSLVESEKKANKLVLSVKGVRPNMRGPVQLRLPPTVQSLTVINSDNLNITGTDKVQMPNFGLATDNVLQTRFSRIGMGHLAVQMSVPTNSKLYQVPSLKLLEGTDEKWPQESRHCVKWNICYL